MIKGIGIDIIEVDRVESAIASQSFFERVYTQAERVFLESRKMDGQTAAGMFAAKEACVKALGRGFGEITHRDIEITHNNFGAPQILLYNKAQEHFHMLNGTGIHISISHIKQTAIAQCIIEGRDDID